MRAHLPRRRVGRPSIVAADLLALPDRDAARAAPSRSREPDGASLVWRCNPNNPTGAVEPAAELVELARATPGAAVVVDEAYVEYGGESVVPWLDECPNLVVLRTLSKAFGFAALRVGYAVARSGDRRRARGAARARPRSPRPLRGSPRRRCATRARRRGGDRRARAGARRARRRRLRLPRRRPATSSGPLRTADLGERLEAQGLVVRRFPDGIRITVRLPAENDVLLRALGAEPGRRRGARRRSSARRPRRRCASRSPSTAAAGARRDRDRLPRPPAHAARVPRRASTSSCVAGGDLDVDEHHTVEDVLAALGDALAQALGTREGVARYGSAVVPMDEARATAAVDLVRRPHAEIALAFTGDRVGGLAVSLLPHALERFAMEAGCTVHVEAAGADDHHVAEAAFKALGRALRQAVAPGDGGIRSTKGVA